MFGVSNNLPRCPNAQRPSPPAAPPWGGFLFITERGPGITDVGVDSDTGMYVYYQRQVCLLPDGQKQKAMSKALNMKMG